ncbi:hypothetical protein [Thermincola ferriacetica]
MNFTVKYLSTLSVLTSVTVMLQLFAGLLPGVGALAAGFTTLFVAMAAYSKPLGGLLVYAAAAGLIGIIMPIKLPLFLFSTGLLGLSLGVTVKLDQNISVLSSSLVLTIGTLVLTGPLGIPVLGPALSYARGPVSLLIIIFAFSWIFCFLWYIFFQRVIIRMGHLFRNIR